MLFGHDAQAFEIEDEQDLRRVILDAFHEKEEFPKMGIKARTEIVQNHSWEARVIKLVNEVENLNVIR